MAGLTSRKATSASRRRASRRTWRNVSAGRSRRRGLTAWQRTRRPQSRRKASGLVVVALGAAAAVAGASAGVHPTGTAVVDPLYVALLSAAITLASSRASREVWLVVSAVAVVMSRSWLVFPALCALGFAFTSVFEHRSRRRMGALIGALVSQVLLRWPPVLFHGFSAIVATLAVGLVFFSAYRRSSGRARRAARWVAGAVVAVLVVFAIPITLAALVVHGDVSRGEHSAESAFTDVENGTSNLATAKLRSATSDFADASSKLAAWWTAPARLVPAVSQQRQVLAQSSAVAEHLASVAADEADKVDYHSVSYHDGQIDLSRLEAMGAPMSTLDNELAHAAQRLDAVRSSWLLQPVESRFSRLENDVSRVHRSTSLAVKAIAVLPGILGADGPRHYFVAFMTPAEQRGLDGFIGSYGELTALDGKVSLTRSDSIIPLENAGVPPSKRVLSGPAEYLARYGALHPEQFPQDDTWSPDLPTVDQVITQLYPQEGGDQLDGVLAIDPYGLASLLKLTGPIVVPGLPAALDSANAAQVLLKDQYVIYGNVAAAEGTPRHEFLQDSLHLAVDDLVNGSLPGPRTLATDLGPAVRQGRISFWSNHPKEQGLVVSIGLAGAFPRNAGGDLLATTTQAAANNKIDAYLHQTTRDDVTYDPSTGSITANLSITLRNDAPPNGLPSFVIDTPNVPGVPPGTNLTWLSVYTPLQFHGALLDGSPATMQAGREFGVNVFSHYLRVPARSSLTLKLKLSGTLGPGTRYTMVLRQQPTANPQSMTVVVHPAAGWTGLDGRIDANWVVGTDEIQSHVFEFTRI